ncbi:hypothetical protein NSS71_08455 [Niallia sp. FSL W8-0951]
MSRKCPTCELIKTKGIFIDGVCDKHPNGQKDPFFKGFSWFKKKVNHVKN